MPSSVPTFSPRSESTAAKLLQRQPFALGRAVRHAPHQHKTRQRRRRRQGEGRRFTHALRQLRSQQHGHDLRAVLRHHQAAHRRGDLVGLVGGGIEHGKGYPRRRRHARKGRGRGAPPTCVKASHLSACGQRLCQRSAPRRQAARRRSPAPQTACAAASSPRRCPAGWAGSSAQSRKRPRSAPSSPPGPAAGRRHRRRKRRGRCTSKTRRKRWRRAPAAHFLNDAFKLAPPFHFLPLYSRRRSFVKKK